MIAIFILDEIDSESSIFLGNVNFGLLDLSEVKSQIKFTKSWELNKKKKAISEGKSHVTFVKILLIDEKVEGILKSKCPASY